MFTPIVAAMPAFEMIGLRENKETIFVVVEVFAFFEFFLLWHGIVRLRCVKDECQYC